MLNYAKILNAMQTRSTLTLADMKKSPVLASLPFRNYMTSSFRRSMLNEMKRMEVGWYL